MDLSTSHHHPDPVHCADSLHAYAQQNSLNPAINSLAVQHIDIVGKPSWSVDVKVNKRSVTKCHVPGENLPITNPPKFLKILTYIAGVRKRTLRGTYKCYLK